MNDEFIPPPAPISSRSLFAGIFLLAVSVMLCAFIYATLLSVPTRW